MVFQIYENGAATKGVFDTLDQAQALGEEYLDGSARIEIKTANSMSQVRTWLYDYSIEQWVEQL